MGDIVPRLSNSVTEGIALARLYQKRVSGSPSTQAYIEDALVSQSELPAIHYSVMTCDVSPLCKALR